jgi:hypothetical protein
MPSTIVAWKTLLGQHDDEVDPSNVVCEVSGYERRFIESHDEGGSKLDAPRQTSEPASSSLRISILWIYPRPKRN